MLAHAASTTSTNSTQIKDNRAAIADANKPSKTKLPSIRANKPAPYIKELEDSQRVKTIGKSSVQAVEMPSLHITDADLDGTSARSNISDTSEENGVALSRPPLKALITVQDNLNPIALDARYWEKISLEDSLDAALAQNLDIDSNFAGLRSQKYKYLSAASQFLPDLSGGYTLAGLNGSIPAALFGGSNTGATTGQSSKLPSSIQLLSAGFTYKAYQGGKVLFSSLEQRHRFRASRAALKGSVNDVLLSTAQRYYNLLYNEALLDIRVRAVEISEEQVRINSSQEKAGTATGLDVLQSQAQLASDQQNLVDQQSTRRQAAIQLAYVMNTSFAQDVTCAEKTLQKRRLIDKTIPIEKLLQIAIDKRPELKQYEELRLAAKRAIVVAAAPLQPTVSLAGSVYGVGASGKSLDPIYVLNFGINWKLGALGTTDLANIQAARWQSRQSAIQAKRTFLDVFQQVRVAYDQSLAADKRIEHASAQIRAAEEELRIAVKRMKAGIGLNIDVLNAQRDLTQAGINKAKALVDFNVAQSQLVHDVGLISASGLTQGVKI
jgi:outer membrane protein TolC